MVLTKKKDSKNGSNENNTYCLRVKYDLYLTPLWQARQFIETCGTLNTLCGRQFSLLLGSFCYFCSGSQKQQHFNINKFLKCRQYNFLHVRYSLILVSLNVFLATWTAITNWLKCKQISFHTEDFMYHMNYMACSKAVEFKSILARQPVSNSSFKQFKLQIEITNKNIQNYQII
jgi:hypothetical protein